MVTGPCKAPTCTGKAVTEHAGFWSEVDPRLFHSHHEKSLSIPSFIHFPKPLNFHREMLEPIQPEEGQGLVHPGQWQYHYNYSFQILWNYSGFQISEKCHLEKTASKRKKRSRNIKAALEYCTLSLTKIDLWNEKRRETLQQLLILYLNEWK